MLGPAEDSTSSSSSDEETESDEDDEKLEMFPDVSDTNTTATTSSFMTITASNDIIDDTTEDLMRNYGMKQLYTPKGQASEQVARTAIIPSISISLTEALNEMEMLTIGESVPTIEDANNASVTGNNDEISVGKHDEPLNETQSLIDTNNTVTTHEASYTDNTTLNKKPITNELLSLGNVPTEEKVTILLKKVNQLQREHSIMLQEMKRQEIKLDQALQLNRDLQKTGKTTCLSITIFNDIKL
ncbi:PREDICTED: uncharacterized protein LOC109581825 [Amphimedon queenslandica]|uniref:Uncharacterized protein n=1 Tax=Amphimedon queenslandica TaxID=400682 RepID=A0AAN0J519_AMPQE|nr:PREDICTED: uncharacterized protein LOC109581825 [Amphimedon queenslandica]|eukprot:XP_019851803.1 PREDICTED: uncharacterized protein LOC109581825 [Amphimedon queenslandica]